MTKRQRQRDRQKRWEKHRKLFRSLYRYTPGQARYYARMAVDKDGY